MRTANPVLPGCHPDPTVCRVGADVYLMTSTFEHVPGLPVYRSRDLVSWELVGHAVHGQVDLSHAVAATGGLYAPTLRHHDGRFVALCTAVLPDDVPAGTPRGNFLVTATDPAGPWSDPVWLPEAEGFDPSLFVDDDGRAWYVGCRPARSPAWPAQTEVWLRELDLAAGRLVGPEHVLWHGALEGAVWAEGPHLYRVGGTYYLLAAEGGTEEHHAQSVARADVVTGPYEGNRANPVLTHRHLGRREPVVGVGHADLVEMPDGSWWAVLLGWRAGLLGRETFLVPVEWEDRWPVLAPEVGRVTPHVDLPWDRDPASAAAGDVNPAELAEPLAAHGWTALRAPVDTVARVVDGTLELAYRSRPLRAGGTPAFVGRRQQHDDLDVRAVVEPSPGAGDLGGLVVRLSDTRHVVLGVARGADGSRRVVVVRTEDDDEREVASAALPAAGPVTLELRIRGWDLTCAYGAGGEVLDLVGLDLHWLDPRAAHAFTGSWIGLYATGSSGATLRVTSFDLRPTGSTQVTDRPVDTPRSER
ncbi:glycoside hydrolase family 43 protein [Cellulomonas composti]|uniref:Glycoside hydrolase 43 family protein n=1 Tax=Cellulomonas composti TaxID=266130 RepID=A0A511JC24_9CELL|nr:glycoside hydrolase family 43 protein [Cellulomonas composti]GEL95524.1 glycoside hydrolase 43 family protein [Cellulomonas composti]